MLQLFIMTLKVVLPHYETLKVVLPHYEAMHIAHSTTMVK